MELKDNAISSLPGYELIRPETKSISLSDYELLKTVQGTNTSGTFEIKNTDQIIGKIQLSFSLRRREVYFDIAINPDSQSKGHGQKILAQLATYLRRYDLTLQTGGIMPESRSYWEKLANEKVVEAINPESSETDYRVMPSM